MCRLRNKALESVTEKFDRRTDRRTDRQTVKVIPMCRYALQATQKSKCVQQNTKFAIVHLSSKHSVTSPTMDPATTIKRKIYHMRHTIIQAKDLKKLTFKWKRKKGGCYGREKFHLLIIFLTFQKQRKYYTA